MTSRAGSTLWKCSLAGENQVHRYWSIALPSTIPSPPPPPTPRDRFEGKVMCENRGASFTVQYVQYEVGGNIFCFVICLHPRAGGAVLRAL